MHPRSLLLVVPVAALVGLVVVMATMIDWRSTREDPFLRTTTLGPKAIRAAEELTRVQIPLEARGIDASYTDGMDDGAMLRFTTTSRRALAAVWEAGFRPVRQYAPQADWQRLGWDGAKPPGTTGQKREEPLAKYGAYGEVMLVPRGDGQVTVYVHAFEI